MVYDQIRKKSVVLTPEELTRQLFLEYLIREKKYRPALIQVEKQIKINGLKKRFDIITFDKSFNPLLLVECKSHKVKIEEKTFEQVSRYNLGLKSSYLVVTNGQKTFCHKVDYQSQALELMKEIPSFNL